MSTAPFKLSYSAHTKCIECEQKYVYSYIMKLPIDPDANDDTLPFRFGKGVHGILEKCEYEMGYFLDKAQEYLDAAIEEHQLDQHFVQCQLASCVMSALTLWQQTGLRVIKCELEIGDEHTIGYVDLIAICPNTRKWYIGDKKTTSMLTNISARLPRDPQLSLYVKFIKQIADACGLNVEDFVGCLYFETIKPKLAMLKTGKESPMAYAKRCPAETQIYFIPYSRMSEDPVAVHSYIYNRILELKAGKIPLRNYKNCLAYSRRCEYWSRCYGEFGSRLAEEMAANTLALVRDGKDLKVVGDVKLTFDYEEVTAQPVQQQFVNLDDLF